MRVASGLSGGGSSGGGKEGWDSGSVLKVEPTGIADRWDVRRGREGSDSSFWPMELESQQCPLPVWGTRWVKEVSVVRQTLQIGTPGDYCPVLSELSPPPTLSPSPAFWRFQSLSLIHI